MDNETIANRLTNYSDALVGVTVVGVSGLSIQLMEPSSRCSLSSAVLPVIIGSVAFAAFVIFLLVTLRRWETDLLLGVPIPEKVRIYAQRLYVARQAIVVISAAAVIVFLLSAAGDPQCVV